jgi:hypothetical protein
MTLFIAWIVFPLVLVVVSAGCGLLLEVASGMELPGALLVPAGFSVVIVASQFPTLWESTARLTVPLVTAVGAAGFVLTPRWRALRFNWWPATAALGAFAAYAAPTVLSGRATFDGYVKLDDTATYLAMLDRIMSHGTDVSNLAPSTYEATLSTSLAYGYPVGSLVPIGVGRTLVGRDAAWLWQPYLAFLGALLALALYVLATRLVRWRSARALVAIVAAQPALLYGYALWGGIKELAIALLIAMLACLLGPLADAQRPLRAAFPLAIASSALVGVLSLGGAVWLAPVLCAALVVAYASRGAAFTLRAAGAFVISAGLLAVPSIVAATEWLQHSGDFTGETELGNLIRPIRWIQTAGIWFNGDFRRDPTDATPVYVLIGVAFAAGAIGFAWVLVRKRWEAVAFGVTAAVGAGILNTAGSPWIAGKALASAAPAAVFFALVCAVTLVAGGRRVEAGVLAAAVVGGVLWSNALAYHDVWLAPSARLAELEQIGKRYSGDGPTLMTEFEVYGARHFLRNMDAETTSELRRHTIPLLNGQPLDPQQYADIDRFQLDGILYYRTLVLRRSPVASRPPSAYRRIERNHWYDVWQRPAVGGATVVEHLPLGTELNPVAAPACADVERLASNPRTRRVVAVRRADVVTGSLADATRPSDWLSDASQPGAVDPSSSGSATLELRVRRIGTYALWVGGSFVGEVTGLVDGRRVGFSRHQLEWTGQYIELGEVRLGRGPHRVEIRYSLGGLRPGSGGLAPFPLGPVALSSNDPDRVVTVEPSQARSLCDGQTFDWIDTVSS